MVAAGILLSRVSGLIRERVFAHFFGASLAADAFKAAFRIPNFLQNLFGEGALSASFIPVYAGLRAEGREDEADRVAGAVLAMLGLLVSLLVLIGVIAAPELTTLLAPGFSGARRELTVTLVRILFPGAGTLVLSAWCLGILNSHHRFFLSYAAPVAWNLVLIATMLVAGGRVGQFPLAEALAWGSVAGSALQFGVQLPVVLALVRHLNLAAPWRSAPVGAVVTRFIPAFASRGVVQLSAFIDEILASLLPIGAVAAMGYAQTLYLLPVSLFGMSVSAAELPLMAGDASAAGDGHSALRARLEAGLPRIAFFVVPSAVAFLALGDVVASAVYLTGAFGPGEARYVWGILAGSAVGLLATTQARLYASTFWALGDTRTPLRYAVVRVAMTAGGGAFAALVLPGLIGLSARWGAAGLSASAGVAGWVEFALLRRSLGRRIGRAGLAPGVLVRLWLAAGVAAGGAWLLRPAVAGWHAIAAAALIGAAYCAVYLGLTWLAGVSECRAWFGGIFSRLGRMIR